jgi:hypothetical protein
VTQDGRRKSEGNEFWELLTKRIGNFCTLRNFSENVFERDFCHLTRRMKQKKNFLKKDTAGQKKSGTVKKREFRELEKPAEFRELSKNVNFGNRRKTRQILGTLRIRENSFAFEMINIGEMNNERKRMSSKWTAPLFSGRNGDDGAENFVRFFCSKTFCYRFHK